MFMENDLTDVQDKKQEEFAYMKVIQDAMATLGWNASRLSKESGVSEATISRSLKGGRGMSGANHNKVLKALGLLQTVPLPTLQPRPIPVVSWIHAGEFAEAANHWPVGVLGDGEPVYSYVKTGPNAFGLRVEGDSMLPRIMPGDIAIVDPELRCDNGSPCVVYVNGETSIKFFWDRETEIVLKSMNDKYPDITIRKDSKVDFRVIGRVVDVRIKFF